MAHFDLFGELAIANVEPWLQQKVDPLALRDSLIWIDDYDEIEVSDVATVLQRFGIAPAASMRPAIADLSEVGGVLAIAAFAAGAPIGMRGRIFAMPLTEYGVPVVIVLENGRCSISRVSIETFATAAGAFASGAPLPEPRKRSSKASADAATGPLVVRRLTAAQYDRAFPEHRSWPTTGAFPEGTSSRPAPGGGFLGITSTRDVWTFIEGRAARLEGLVAAGPLQSEVGPDAWWVVRDDGALVRIDPSSGKAEAVPTPPVYDVCLGPSGHLITMGRDATLRLLAVSDAGPRVIAALPFRDEPDEQTFPTHRIQSLPDGRAGLCIAYDRCRVFGASVDRLVYLDTDEMLGLTMMVARTDILAALGRGGRMHVFEGTNAALRAVFGHD